jgi:hypothetical protein
VLTVRTRWGIGLLVDQQTAWTRRRLQVLLGGGLVVAVALVAGAAWLLIGFATRDLDSGERAADGRADTAGSAEDQLARKPLADAPLEAAQPGPLSSRETSTLPIPAPTRVGDAGVATGYPHTPEGALAQLAAIDSTALESGSVRVAQAVIEHWAVPGGPTAETWTGVHAVAALLGSAGTPADARDSMAISVEPTMGYIKGTVGQDFVVPCIDFIVTATLTARAGGPTGRPQQVAAADCQRMVWQEDRWMIGAGDEPAPAPSLWPGTEESFDAGYRWLEMPQS